MANKLDHIGIFVDDLDAAIAFYRTVIGTKDPIIREVPELKLKLAFFTDQGGEIIELVSTTGKTEMGQGDVVVALEVEDLDAEIARYGSAGIKVHDQPPTENLPLRRGWVTKGGGMNTIIELCPKGAVRAFVTGAA
ncbi:VOC family protein [Mesobacterium pallidum]|uniref:VOC family protein n=1 Tax=Mesobacterium pallidum TaxID=2872037 RepID=UPI001EE33E98|nr:VOC family protein [Mesobacterium pallidum]